MANLSLEDLQKMQRLLDEQAVPKEGRFIRYLDKEGNEDEMSPDVPMSTEQIQLLPDWLKVLGGLPID